MHHNAILSVSKTSTVTEAVTVLSEEQMFFERVIALPGRSDWSLAGTTPHRLQLCCVTPDAVWMLLDRCTSVGCVSVSWFCTAA